MSEDEILTIEELARYLKLKPQTVYKWAQDGQVPGAKLGKEWRFKKSHIDEWIDLAMIRSPGGFDLMLKASATSVAQSGKSRDDLESILKEAMERP